MYVQCSNEIMFNDWCISLHYIFICIILPPSRPNPPASSLTLFSPRHFHQCQIFIIKTAILTFTSKRILDALTTKWWMNAIGKRCLISCLFTMTMTMFTSYVIKMIVIKEKIVLCLVLTQNFTVEYTQCKTSSSLSSKTTTTTTNAEMSKIFCRKMKIEEMNDWFL